MAEALLVMRCAPFIGGDNGQSGCELYGQQLRFVGHYSDRQRQWRGAAEAPSAVRQHRKTRGSLTQY